MCGERNKSAARRIHSRRQEKICCTQNLFLAVGKNCRRPEFICGTREKSAPDGINSPRLEKIYSERNTFSVV
jgi:hypothetical protein